ncbi:hypothetical protein BJY54_004679 [Streptomyces nodosus]|uniref:Uncharacterized protein n=1 Tax=Streptomyces nodosus TaxID=40318 RepID=A0A0B5DHQ6_9ACTN|nr:hypothetical protein SNOD_23835 [Streptomyces nodosus]MBB4794067.1 hypothetical protein [Streptomyces nodosus]
MNIGLVQWYAVDGDVPVGVTALDGVAADRDDPLDEVLVVVGGQQTDPGEPLLDLFDDDGVVLLGRSLAREPVAGVLEDDHVAALRMGAEPGGQLVDQDAVADLDRVLHGARGDHEGLHQERLQDERYEDGDADQEGYLLDGGAPPLALDLALELAPLGPAASGGAAAPGAP